MVGFFARSLTGIKYLVGEQYQRVRSVTGEDPKVSFMVEDLEWYADVNLKIRRSFLREG